MEFVEEESREVGRVCVARETLASCDGASVSCVNGLMTWEKRGERPSQDGWGAGQLVRS